MSYVMICPLIQAMLPYTVVNIKGQLEQEPATWFLIKQMAVQFPLCSWNEWLTHSQITVYPGRTPAEGLPDYY